jgi:HEAT repeat protein
LPDAAQIARALTEKYGSDALRFARDRARRAREIGDEIAVEAWRNVIEETQHLLRSTAAHGSGRAATCRIKLTD